MDAKTIGRFAVALVLALVAAWLAYSFVTMPYQLVASTTTRAQPDGSGVFFMAVVFAVAAVLTAAVELPDDR